MAQELDIFQDTTKEELFADSVMAAENQDGSGDGGMQPVDTGTPTSYSYVVGEDGHYYNDDGERVYYWVPPSELGDVVGLNRERTLYQDTGGYYTEQEIRQAWNAKEGMGYLKERISWENYWGYLTERQSLIESGELYDATGATKAGRDARQDVIREGGGLRAMGGAKGAAQGGQSIIWEGYSGYYSDFLNQQAQLDLMEKYGIPSVFYNDDGDVFQWNGSSYTKTFKVDDSLPVGQMMFAVAVGLATSGSGVGSLFGGGAAGGAASGAIGSAISQGIVNGKIDPTAVVTAGILGGLGGWFDDLRAATPGAYGGWVIDGTQLSDASQWMIEKTQYLADILGIPFNEASGIVQGVLQGTVSGEDLEGIALNAIGGWSQVKIKDYFTAIFGDGIDVDNWFREGDSFIPTEAFFPFIEIAIQGAIDGGVSKVDLLKMLGAYFQAGGDLDFILPGLPDLDLESAFPDLGFDFCEQYPDFPGLCKDIDVDGTDIKLDEFGCTVDEEFNTELGKCVPKVDIKVPEITCPDGQEYNTELGECVDIKIPEINCPDGQEYNTELGECVDIEVPKVGSLEGLCSQPRPEEYGFPQINWDRYCKAPEINCPDGQEYNTELGECVDIKLPDTTCPDGFRNEDGECVKIDLPSVDVDAPPISLGQPAAGMFSPLEAKGLSYEQQTPTPLVQSAPVDAMASITSFINRKLNERQSDQDISNAFNSDPDKGMFS